jgi:Fe-S cluster assembly iron-binding protein IscA
MSDKEQGKNQDTERGASQDTEQGANIKITETAAEYLKTLVERQESGGMGVRIFVEKPGTPHAECCIAYCPSGESEPGDHVIQLDGFNVYLKQDSMPYLLPSDGAIPPGELPSWRGKSSSSSSPTTLPSWGGQSPSTCSTAPSHLKP